MKKVELLAPAGDMKALIAAIEAGCDAVYLAGKLFSARSFATNFTNEEIIEAINYSHLYGVKVYVTVNTIIYEREVENFIDYIRFLHKNNVDAVIIQDLGMLDLIRKKFPNLELHASTQMHIHNYEGALFAANMGIKRVVMARETPLKEIEKIKKDLDIEVEVFIHGALCLSYSGQCLMSALIGNRSGNRGTCAQVCRKAYDLYDINNNKLNKENYLLSTKDLCTLNYIDKLIDLGVDSFKIEGRMKRCEYVYLVTKIYRQVIYKYINYGKLKINEEDILNLKKVFNRDFTKGFMFKENNNEFVYQKRPNHKGIKIGEVIKVSNNNLFIKLIGDLNVNDGLRIEDEKEDKGIVVNEMFINNTKVKQAKKGDIIRIKYDKFVKLFSIVLLTTDYNQIKSIDEILKKRLRKVLIDMKITIYENKNILIEVSDKINKVLIKSDFICDKAINNPLTEDIVIKQMSKTNNTIYKINNILVNLDSNVFVNIKDLNDLRRKALLKLNEKRLYKSKFIEKNYDINLPSFDIKKEEFILLDNEKDYFKYKDMYKKVYTSNKKLLNYDNVVYKIPRVNYNYPSYNKLVLISEVGSIIKYNNFETDFTFNVVNSYTLAFLHSLGSKKVTLSYELSINQIKLIIENYMKRYKKYPNCEVIIDSYPEVMISKFDLNKMYNVKESYLKDIYKNKYFVKTNSEYMTIYNYKKVIYDKDELLKIGVNNLRKNI